MDKARQKTDKKLKTLEREIKRVYRDDLSLQKVKAEYDAYMSMVEKRVEASYRAFVSETDKIHKDELKRVYMGQIAALTRDNFQYKMIVRRFVRTMAEVNQRALDLANAEMSEIYVLNYNQVAEECKRVGIEVNNGEADV